MYSKRAGLILAFHGCDRTVRDKVVLGEEHLLGSDNDYDWLGHGIYFWEHSPERALDYAVLLKDNPHRNKRNPIKDPAVLGAVIDLGLCLDLLESKSLKILKHTYETFKYTQEVAELSIPTNRPIAGSKDLLIRELDCAVIQFLHQVNKEQELKAYDSVRGVFIEGDELYPSAGFNDKNHIQICVRNPNCILGYFIPREVDNDWSMP